MKPLHFVQDFNEFTNFVPIFYPSISKDSPSLRVRDQDRLPQLVTSKHQSRPHLLRAHRPFTGLFSYSFSLSLNELWYSLDLHTTTSCLGFMRKYTVAH